MSDLLPMFDGDDGFDGGDGGDSGDSGDHNDARDRNRSLLTLALVLIFAVAVAGIAVLALHSPGSSHTNNQLAGPTQAVTVAPPSAPTVSSQPVTTLLPSSSASSTPTRSPTKSASTSASASSSAPKTTPASTSAARTSTTPAPPSTSDACPCSLDGDGGAIAALNAYRKKLHRKLAPAEGSVTPAAKSCAESLAFGIPPAAAPFCPPSAASAVETSQDGQQAVLDAYSHGGSWFTDPKLKSFQVGWAKDAAGRYYCVFLEG